LFDTLKIAVHDVDLLCTGSMIKIETHIPISEKEYTTSTKYIYPRSNNCPYVSWKESDPFFTLEFSAKILGDKYLEGINKKNIDSVKNTIIKNCSALEKLPDLKETMVFRADHTLNLKTKLKTNYLRMLRESASWSRKRIDKRFSDSAIFYNTKELILTYDKYQEVKKFWSEFKDLNIPEKDFFNLLRIEYRPRKISVMRNNLDLQKSEVVFLENLFDNYYNTMKEKIGSFQYAEINDNIDYSDFLFGNGKRLDTNFKTLGLFTYFKSLNFDISLIERDLKNIDNSGTRSKIRSKLKKISEYKEIGNNLSMIQLQESFKREFKETLEKIND
jgi:hypothetical protein